MLQQTLQPRQSWRLLTLVEYYTTVNLCGIVQTFHGYKTCCHHRIVWESEV